MLKLSADPVLEVELFIPGTRSGNKSTLTDCGIERGENLLNLRLMGHTWECATTARQEFRT